MLSLVSETLTDRGNPFVVFTSFFDRNTSCSRFITDNDHTGPGSVVKYPGGGVYGEDPRPFVWKGMRHLLSQRFVGSFETVIQTIVNVDTGEHARYTVNSPGFSYGKNWAPFVFNDELYMIHSFGPLRILKDSQVWKEVENPVVPKVCYTGGRPFCMFRGGTNGLQVSATTVIGVGHATIYQPSVMHTPTFWRIDFSKGTFEMAVLKGYRAVYSIADPTSLWVEDGEMYLSMFESSKEWFSLDCKTATRIFKVSPLLADVDMTAWKYYTCLSIA
jgi:hypothetical protein